MYRIGMFSQIGKTTIKTLRYYEKVGILSPAYVDEENGYRYYTTDQLFTLHEILGLRQMNFSIEEIKNILSGENVEETLKKRRQETKEELDTVMDQLSRIDYYIEKRKEEQRMSYQAVIKEIPECIVFSKVTVLPSYEALFEVMPKLGKAVKELNPGLKCAEPEYCFNMYLDGEYKEKDINVDVCEAVEDFGVAPEGVTFKKIPGVTAVTTLHKGPYENLGQAYAFIFKWIEDNGYEVVGNPRESYIDGIWNKESKEDWLTEIQVPVKK